MYLISGALLFSVSVAWVASPAGLVSGGVSGIGIVIKEITGVVPIALTSFVLNVPLFLISFFQRGFRFIAKSLFAFLLLTVLLAVFEAIPTPFSFGEDLLAAALVFGALSGVGLGFVLRAGATSGGTDML
ncbi:MAG: YitT family protein, partial [Clostridia bacterium]|nr:YitT family protein [Clostridia bacterium]